MQTKMGNRRLAGYRAYNNIGWELTPVTWSQEIWDLFEDLTTMMGDNVNLAARYESGAKASTYS